MKKAAAGALFSLLSACAWAPRPGPTEEGLAVRVEARQKEAARREAVAALLPLFVSDAVRRGKTAAIEEAALAPAGRFVGRERRPGRGDWVVEVRVNALSAALQQAGLSHPPGYSSGGETGLIAFGDRAAAPDAAARLAADAFRIALFGRGIAARDADDPLLRLRRPMKSKTEAETAAEAAAGGWSWLAAGRVEASSIQEPRSAAWRGRARLSLSLYDVDAGTEPARVDVDGWALEVSSVSAASRAIEQSAQTAAVHADKWLERRRSGRRTIAVLLSGGHDQAFIARVLRELRGIPGIEAAALAAWGVDGSLAVVHAYALGLTPDALAARLIGAEPPFKVTGVETEDGRLTIEDAESPLSVDQGQVQ